MLSPVNLYKCIFLLSVAFNSLSNDPCYSYQSLDHPWRATNESGTLICDDLFSMSGWYRFFYYGMDVRMPESCVGLYSCNGYNSLWLNGPHPQIEDGVVTIEVCGTRDSGCCELVGVPIRVKACPGNYYVYEFKEQSGCTIYCIGTDLNSLWIISLNVSLLFMSKCSNCFLSDVSTISPTASFTTSAGTAFDMTLRRLT